jgi:hypothetical protein
MMRALLLYGGWPGHFPYDIAEWADGILGELGFEVTHIHDPDRLAEDLTIYDVIVCGWTQSLTTEDLTENAERSLLGAVSAGTGFVGWHGATAAFRASLPFSFLLGASFIEHPGGEGVEVPYNVKIVDRSSTTCTTTLPCTCWPPQPSARIRSPGWVGSRCRSRTPSSGAKAACSTRLWAIFRETCRPRQSSGWSVRGWSGPRPTRRSAALDGGIPAEAVLEAVRQSRVRVAVIGTELPPVSWTDQDAFAA